jgi:vacuolar protein sorting-associated protein 54
MITSMLHDIEFFQARLSKIDGFGNAGEYLMKIIKSKEVKKAAPSPPPPPPPAAATIESKETEAEEEKSSTKDDGSPGKAIRDADMKGGDKDRNVVETK